MLALKVFLATLAVATAYTDIDDKKYAIVLGDRLKLQALYKCVTEQSPCDAFGKPIKGHMTELLADRCRECDETQKHYAHILTILMKNDYPDLYEIFEKKIDPSANIVDLEAKTKDS